MFSSKLYILALLVLQLPFPLLSTAAPSTTKASGSLPTLAPVSYANTSILTIEYYDSAPTDKSSPVAILVHGFPYSIDCYVYVVPKLVAQGYRVIVPSLRGYGGTRFLSPTTLRSSEQAALGKDIIDLMDTLQIDKATFVGFDWGTLAVNVAAALWPDRCSGMVAANSYIIQNRQTAWAVAPPSSIATRWYFYVFLTPQGYSALASDTKGWAETLWAKNSPKWKFKQEELDAASLAFYNEDYVDIVTFFYRYHLLYASGDPQYAELENELDKQPPIKVPSVTLDPDEDVVFQATNGSESAKFFLGPRSHHIINGVGEAIPLENPQAIVDAVLEVAKLK